MCLQTAAADVACDSGLCGSAGLLASPQSAPGNLDDNKNAESRGNGGSGSRENSTVDFSKVNAGLRLTRRLGGL